MRVEHHDKIESTNDRALAIIRAWRDDPPVPVEPVLIIAAEQTAGRGRMGRTWQSPRGGAWFSIVWPWYDMLEKAQPIPLVVGLAVHQVMAGALGQVINESELIDKLRLKWPNDLLWDDRKLAGVLCETQFNATHGSSTPHGVAIGVGINVNPFVDDSAGRAFTLAPISVFDITQTHCDIAQLVESCAERIAMALHVYNEHGFTPECTADLNRILAWRGENVTVRSHRRHHDADAPSTTGRIEALDAKGRLLIKTDGSIVALDHGELRRVVRAESHR